MHLPYLKPPEQSVEMISQFGGYNHKLSIGESEFFDMKNMSAKDFPLAATRQKRGTLKIGGSSHIENAQGIVAENKLLIPYIGKGDIGVKVKQNVEAKERIEIAQAIENGSIDLPNSELIENEWYTKICSFKNDAAVNAIKDKLKVDELIRYVNKEGKIKAVASGKKPIISGDSLYVKWPHVAIEAGIFFAKTLFEISYVHERDGDIFKNNGDRLILSANDNEYLSNADLRAALIGYEFVFVDKTKWKPIKILAIEKLGKAMLNNWGTSAFNNGLAILRKGDWVITVATTDGSDIKESYVEVKDEFIIPVTDTLLQTITAREDEKAVLRKLNQPTEVSVEAKTPTHLQVLLGKTVNFSGDDIYVSGIDTTDGAQKIYLDLPHGAITEGSTIEGDRLFIAECDPESGELITSDIFAAAEGEHRFVEMGANLVIFPEKVVVNTLKKNADGQLEDIQQLEFTNVLKGDYAYRLCDVNGNKYTSGFVGNNEPTTSNGKVWIDTSEDPPILKVYSDKTAQWVKTQPYCEIYTQADSDKNLISDVWQVGDAIELEFGAEGGGEMMRPLKEQKYFVISAVGENEHGKRYIRIPLALTAFSEVAPGLETDTITLKRTMPEMDFVIENKNRLWGCKYGLVDGEMINEIFACKLGDPKNWHHFTNTAIDSYYVTMGENGAFTGAISYKDNPIFFREDCMHRILGDYPAAFGMHVIDCHGVEAGSNKSLTVMNDVLFYKSPVGIMAYTGATPVIISDCFGNEKYKNAVACSLGNKLLFSMTDSKNEKSLFAFDDLTKLWHKEDNLAVKDFAVYGGEIYALTDDNSLISMHGLNGTAEDDFEWFLESGKIGFMTPFRKRISKVTLRLLMELDTRASISVQYDSSGHFEHISTLRPQGKVRSIAVPVMPRRCDHFALRIEGKGAIKILSMTKTTEEGSDYE